MTQVLTAAQRPPAIRTPYVVLVCLIASVGGFLFGYDINVIIGALIFLRRYFHLTPVELGFAVACATLGCGAGAMIGGYIADRLGRKKTLALTAVIFALGGIGTAIPRTTFEFDVFRIVGGVGVGLASIVSPMYIAEISPAHLRGRLVTIDQLAILTGAVISVTLCYYLSLTGDWRAMFASEALPAVVLLVGIAIVPESPRWLLEMHLADRARESLGRIYRQSEAIECEIKEIAESLHAETGSFRELFQPGLRRALLVGVVLAIFVQWTGIGSLNPYLPLVFQMAGFRQAPDAILQMAIVNAWMWICTVLAIWLVDRIGRRPLLLAGILGMAAGLAMLGILFARHVTGEIVVLTTMFCMGCFIASLAPLFWLLTSELFPTRLRGKGMSISSLAHWMANFAAVQAFPSLIVLAQARFHSIGVVFWFFAAVCLAALAFTYSMVPETKGRTLEEIGRSWTASRTDI